MTDDEKLKFDKQTEDALMEVRLRMFMRIADVAARDKTIAGLRKSIAEKDAQIATLRDLAADHETTWTELREATGCDTHAAALDWIRRHREKLAERDAKIQELEKTAVNRNKLVNQWEEMHLKECQLTESIRSELQRSQQLHQQLFSEIGATTQAEAIDWIRTGRRLDCSAAEQPAPEPEGELVPWDAETRPRGVVMFRSNYIDQHIERTLIEWSRVDARVRGWGLLSFADLLRSWEWSRDGITWQPCGVRKAVRS